MILCWLMFPGERNWVVALKNRILFGSFHKVQLNHRYRFRHTGDTSTGRGIKTVGAWMGVWSGTHNVCLFFCSFVNLILPLLFDVSISCAPSSLPYLYCGPDPQDLNPESVCLLVPLCPVPACLPHSAPSIGSSYFYIFFKWDPSLTCKRPWHACARESLNTKSEVFSLCLSSCIVSCNRLWQSRL